MIEVELELDEYLELLSNKLKEKIKEKLKEYGISSNSKIYDAIDVKVIKDGLETIIDIPFIESVEYGSNREIPIGPLIKWAKTKFGANDKEAYIIASTIQKNMNNSTGARPFLRKAIFEFTNSK